MLGSIGHQCPDTSIVVSNQMISPTLLEMKLPYDPVCLKGLKGRKFHFHASIGALVNQRLWQILFLNEIYPDNRVQFSSYTGCSLNIVFFSDF